MKKGFTKAEIKAIEKHIAGIEGEIDKLIEFLTEKRDLAEEWAEDRCEGWDETENGEAFLDWISEIDDKIDMLEDIKSEVDMENLDDIL